MTFPRSDRFKSTRTRSRRNGRSSGKPNTHNNLSIIKFGVTKPLTNNMSSPIEYVRSSVCYVFYTDRVFYYSGKYFGL